MNRMRKILQLRAIRTHLSQDDLREIDEDGPDRWLRRRWGLTGHAAESAWWGVMLSADRQKRRR